MKNKIYIFGTHSRAQTLAAYLCFLDEDIHIEAYFYDNDEKNPENIGEIPVFKVNGTMDINALNLSLDYPVYIGTRGIFHKKITEMLTEIGFKVIYPVTVEMDLMLRNQYLEKYYSSIGREPLQQEYSLASYEKEIYAGAVFAEKFFHLLPEDSLRDDAGDNISAKNKQFCELTALYWIWKHAGEDILGLVHYRRHFLFPKNWKECMLSNQVDVILPVPLYVAPTVEENFKSRHDPSDWEFMMQYLKDNFPEDYQAACRFFKGNLYAPCNMFVMKREVLDALCGWLFPILFKVAEYGGEKDNSYLNRYPGFISERLISLYFEINREKFKLVYADKNFLP